MDAAAVAKIQEKQVMLLKGMTTASLPENVLRLWKGVLGTLDELLSELRKENLKKS